MNDTIVSFRAPFCPDPFTRFALWVPNSARYYRGFAPDAIVEGPDGLWPAISTVLAQDPKAHVFVGGRTDNDAQMNHFPVGVDWWPVGIAVPSDFHIGFRTRAGQPNTDGRQMVKYARARARHIDASSRDI